jgi:hypothetical protein
MEAQDLHEQWSRDPFLNGSLFAECMEIDFIFKRRDQHLSVFVVNGSPSNQLDYPPTHSSRSRIHRRKMFKGQREKQKKRAIISYHQKQYKWKRISHAQ